MSSHAVRYAAAALAAAVVVMLIALAAAPASARSAVAVGGALGILVQLGLVPFLSSRLIGDRALAALGLAMGCRFLVFALAAFVLVPLLSLSLPATLFTLAGVFFATSLLEPVLLRRPSSPAAPSMFVLIPLFFALQVSPAAAQEVPPPPTVPAHATAAEEPAGDDIMHHVLDERVVKAPWGYVQLPPAGSWMVGPIDLTPTKYVVYLWITGLLTLLLILPAAQAAKRARRSGRVPTGGHNVIEGMVLFFRDEVVMRNIGHGGERFAPFVITLFFFIVVANILGLVPYGGSVTASISVTATLALLSFVAIEAAGMQALGARGYLGTIFYWNRDLVLPLRIIMLVILTPVEILGKLAKPFALAVRLMANMAAGKILILALIGLIFIFGSWWVVAGPVIMTVALTFLKIFVAFLQAFIFALLTSVFIGMIRHAH